MWSAKLGFPHAISDTVIEVDLPSNQSENADQDDIPDCCYLVAMIELARLTSQIMGSIYGSASQKTSLSQRVQSALTDLRKWKDELPESLMIKNVDVAASDSKACYLQLMFNQLLITATRPILLHVVRTRVTQPPAESQIPEAAHALADTCVKCARHSCSLLTESWTNGSLMIFDYFDTQYMFSSATILALSISRDESTSGSDRDRLECLEQFLSQLKGSGNFAAAEFHQHISAISSFLSATEIQSDSDQMTAAPLSTARDVAGELSYEPRDHLHGNTDNRFASEITLEDPLFCNLLAQPATDLQFIDEASFADIDFGLSWYNTEI
ncbi:hypothetical protein MBLNU13_g05278t1 [Cladosporium sp. NU13]